ncbi:hypothetical protein A2415_04265 [candidate division WWE3 bacterium RIFOXYC1_FULL_39_7]|uniref:Uncharacterized protein n=2 Tax=Katanobacteria TaxID=422282 RepID=A0A1F4X7K6_UNCKA|nr:MAG: hypothetical protein A2415_04265 [candidate division WWE3 bacterium RIFOXYC1_FULL_39_7]OGC77664.1 MAG: hypothetical protein A2619_05520 [candidate division WWE3 bacterium RIFOXYD1_FULL_39_9]
MNSTDQAQKGFKTFLLTLSISLILFSVVYYVITSPSLNKSELSADVEEEQVSYTEETVFGDLASQKMDVPTRAVLAGADGTAETTQGTAAVPDSGTFEVTLGLILSGITFLTGLFVISKDPRKIALSGFEKRVVRGLK